MSPRFVLGRENVPCVAEVVNRSLKADCTDFTHLCFHFVKKGSGENLPDIAKSRDAIMDNKQNSSFLFHWKKSIPSKLCNYFGKTLAKQIFRNCSENWNFEFPKLFQWIEFQCMEFLWKSFLMSLRIDGFCKMFGSC